MIRASFIASALLLAACGAAPPSGGAGPADLSLQTRAITSQALFGTPRPYAAERSNAQIAKDILELGFRLESGREIPHFSRFEGPVTLSLQGQIPPLALIETERLLARMRAEAGLDIRRVEDGKGRVIVEFVPRAQMRRVVRDAACFVLPNIPDWASFRANPRAEALDWTRVVERQRALVIAPADSTVQEMRDCLHEEIAQAVGPLNDLFRIGESVMNDDNFQTILTGFDMLVLRVWNDSALRPGMTRAEVAERLPAMLARLNPRGERAARNLPLDPVPTPRDWTDAIEDALRTTSNRTSFRHARRALEIALDQGWQDDRLAFSLFLAARFAPPGDGQQALDALVLAHRIYETRPGTQAHSAHVSLHLAAQSLATGQNDLVLRLTERAMLAAQRTENGALLSSLMLLRARALEATGKRTEAEELRRAAVPFALFGFGTKDAAERRASEVAALGQRE